LDAHKRRKQDKPEHLESFTKLQLSIGTILYLETRLQERKYQVQLIGSSSDKSILISPPIKSGKSIFLDQGEWVKVSLLAKTFVYAFEAKVILRATAPYEYLHLSYPKQVEARKVRNAERISTTIETNIDNEFDNYGDWPKHAVITDLSKTGARIIAREKLGEFGHELVLSFPVKLSDMVQQVNLSAIIRNAYIQADAAENKSYVFGLQFLEMSDAARLVISNYIYEQREQ